MVELASAVNRGVIRTSVLFSVEVNNFCTVSNQIADRIQSIGLDNGGERHQGNFRVRMPDHALDETFASANGEEVNLSGGIAELHWVLS